MRSFKKIVVLSIAGLMLMGGVSLATAGDTVKAGVSAKELKQELLKLLVPAEKKLVALAQAMPEGKFAWRPNDKVRTFGEANLHVAATNYWVLVYLGDTLPKDVPITKEFKTAFQFEKNKTKEQVIKALQGSFKLFKEKIEKTPAADLFKTREYFGTKGTLHNFFLLFVTHNHEHLGQLIAYARSCNVKPPWSK